MEVVTKKMHKVTIDARKAMTLTCVSEVLGFSDTLISAKSDMGKIVVQGSGLKIIRFDALDGYLELSGEICSLKYLSNSGEKKGSFAQRIFK